ncbi:MAG: ABC transporter substrate-binding protein [Actinobacteria bacterium]|nr:ABC transporter substrate-binding protein [Actinomycetota bacterium]
MTRSRFRSGRRAITTVAITLAIAVVLAACGSSSSSSKTTGTTAKAALTVGSKNFGGAQVISQLYGQALAAQGYRISYKDNIGATEIIYKALVNGDIDMYGEYQGTLLTYLNGTPTSDAQTTNSALQQKLPPTLVASSPAPAVDVNGFYVLKATADKYHLTTLSSLVPVAPQLVFGGTPECQDRPLCLGTKEQQLYNLKFKDVKKLDEGGPVTEKALDDGTVQVALLFTGSSVIKPDYVLLQDDKGLQPADNPVAVIKKSVDTPAINAIIDKVNAALTVDAYNKLALQVQNDKLDPKTVASAFLKQQGLA